MRVASALVSGDEATPKLVETAVRQALARAGLRSAGSVLLFLTPEFSRQAQEAVTAAVRAASCLQVAGGIAAGVFTEDGWALDRPAAAVMVFGEGMAFAPVDEEREQAVAGGAPTLLCYGSEPGSRPRQSARRFGGSFAGKPGASALVWQAGRVSAAPHCALAVGGPRVDLRVSSGLSLLGPATIVDAASGNELVALGGQSPLASLRGVLPAEWHELPLHRLAAVLIDDAIGGDTHAALGSGLYREVAIVAVNADGSLTLADPVERGQRLAWAIRTPDSSTSDMQAALGRLAADSSTASAALMFSCIGRGPYFYGGEDCDLALFSRYFPGLPLLGVYASTQFAWNWEGVNRSLRNSVVVALLSAEGKKHVQSVA
ncbi:FIST C-terminal domain-containing protein [Rhodocyclus purpureus]|uniref:FIST C-terminal domain-containing protein n=1 Tax=Rhodocyclus purpureus TaxID=1067 RepID=UPI001912A08F|nr:FIST C-terminal domain-containing protein [Rhodocyclus purpureus]